MSAPTDNIQAEIQTWFETRGAQVMRQLGVRPGARVLDFGCGPGRYAVPLAQTVGSKGLVIAVDRHKEPLEELRQRWKTFGATGEVRTVQATDESALADIGDGTLDAVFLFDILQHVPDWEALFTSIARTAPLTQSTRSATNATVATRPLMGTPSFGLAWLVSADTVSIL